jgi:hypothetical protein
VEKTLKSPKPKLKIDWATHTAAKYACESWHYSKCMPCGAIVKIGVWENDKFIGVVLFSRGATPNLCKPYGLMQTECCELTRIALNKHETPVSKILSIALIFFKKQNPGMKIIVSFADASQGHHGGIYQATNWLYSGKSNDAKFGLLNGKEIHPRTISTMSKQKKDKLKWVVKPGKHRYLLPLNGEMKLQIEKLRLPYPKRASSVESGTSAYQAEGGGESPTDALQTRSDNGPTN